MAVNKEDILVSLISAEEKDRIPEDIASKLATAFNNKLNDVTTEQGVIRKAKDKSERNLRESKQKYNNLHTSYETQTDQLITLTTAQSNLETQLRANTDELGAVWQKCTLLETEAAKLRQERQFVVDERDTASVTISRADADLSKYKDEVKHLQEQLQRESDGKYKALAQLGDIDSRLLQLDNKEKHFERECTVFKTQADAMEKQLVDRTQELLTIRRDSSGHSVLLETHLSTLQSEHWTLQKQHTTLHQQHTELATHTARVESDAKEAQQTGQQQLDAVQLELEAQRKLAELLQIDSEAKTKQVDELERDLDAAVKRRDELKAQLKLDCVRYENLIGKKSECVELLRKELQLTSEQLDEVKLNRSSLVDMFPDAAQMSDLLSDGASMSLTQIYNVYVQTNMQLIEERDETERQRGYIRKLTEELQEKGPMLQLANRRFGQLTQAQDDLMQEMERMRERLLEHDKCSGLKQQLNDLGRQVCKLLHVGSQDMTSKDLVTFDSVEELQQNNQRLLATVRELTDKQRLAGDVKQLEQQLKQLTEANAELLDQQQRQENLVKMITEQCDRYQMLCEQQIINKPCGSTEDKQPLNDNTLQLKKQIEQLTIEHEVYRKDKNAFQQLTIEVGEELRLEFQRLNGKHAAQTATLDITERNLAAAKRNTVSLRNQVGLLEDRLQIHASAQIKLEDSVMQHKDTLYETISKLSKSEVTLGQTQKDMTLLKDANERLLKERDAFRSDCQSLKVMKSNLSITSASIECAKAENRLRLEITLNKQRQDCIDLQQKLTDEQNNAKVLTGDLQAKTEAVKKSLEEERAASEKLRSDLAQTRIELTNKIQQLNVVAQQSNNSKVLHSRQLELESVKQSLDAAKVSLKQQSDTAEQAIRQLTVLSETYTRYRTETHAKISKLRNECASLRDLNADDTKMEKELKTVLEQLRTQEAELVQCNKAADEMSNKYEREVKLHSDDLLAVASLKRTLEKVQSQLKQLQSELSKLRNSETVWNTHKADVAKVKLELQQQHDELTAQNKQLQDELLNTSNASLNQSMTEEEARDSSSPLLKNIQYIKRKMEVALSKLDVVNSENARLKLDLNVAQKRMTDVQQTLTEERQKGETSAAANTSVSEEVLTRVERLDAITDSNRVLRIERDGQAVQIKDMHVKIDELRKEMEQLNGAKHRCEALQSENATLRGEATRWRQRANTLIEKTNRTSPEDWKKLQTERETLAKQLTIERANIVRLNDDLTTANQDKGKLEESVKELRSTSEELTINKAELESVKATHDQLSTDNLAMVKDLENKNSQLTDLRGQQIQLRRIAKKYKQQYESTQEAASAESADKITTLQEELRVKSESSEAAITELTAKNEDSAKELEKTKDLMQVNKDRFTQVLKNVKDRMAALTEQKNRLEKGIIQLKPSSDDSELKVENERYKSEVEELKTRLSQLQRLLEDSNSSVGQTSGDTVVPPTANIKPMAGHMTSIRPVHPLQQSQSRSSTGVPQVSVQPQQQMQVHTTAVASTSTAPIDSGSLPSSSHGSTNEPQQLPTIRVLPSVVVDTSSSATLAVVGVVSATTQQQQQQQQQQQPTVTVTASSSVASGSGTSVVTTSGVKRTRSGGDALMSVGGDGGGSAVKVQQVQPLVKRGRLMLQQQQQQLEQGLGGVEGVDDVAATSAAGASEGDVEYQVPTSSHDDERGVVAEEDEDEDDDDDDMGGDMHAIRLAVSDDEDTDTAEAVAAEDIHTPQAADDNNTADDAATTNNNNRKRKRSKTDTTRTEQAALSEVMEDNAVEMADDDGDGDEATAAAQDQVVDDGQANGPVAEDSDGVSSNAGTGQQMEAISSSNAATSSSDSGTRVQQQQQQQLLVLPEEAADDGIVPSTPTLVLPSRRSGGTSGEGSGVSSPHPHVPTVTAGRLFTFNTLDRAAAADAAVGEQEVQPGGSDDTTTDESERNVVPASAVQSPSPEPLVAAQSGDDDGAQAQQQQLVEGSEEAIIGEPSTASVVEDEGSEAEATPVGGNAATTATIGIPRAIPTIGGQRRVATTAARPVSTSGGSAAPSPIPWGLPQHQQGHMGAGGRLLSPRHLGRGLGGVQRMRRIRGAMPPRGGYSRY